MSRLMLISAMLISLISPSYQGQTINPHTQVNEDWDSQRLIVFSELQSLEIKASRLDRPLARAAAKTEIAAAAWTLDKEWAKKLLNEAYELTFPDEEEQRKLSDRPAGSAPIPPTEAHRARGEIRNRVLAVASQDKTFSDMLIQLGAQRLGKYEEHLSNAMLAHQALNDGHIKEAISYILQAIEADPTQITVVLSILDIATQDRPAADRLIVRYMERLRRFPHLTSNNFGRVYLVLYQLVFPSSTANINGRTISSPGPDVMRAYVSFVIETLDGLEQQNPGLLKRARSILMTAWLPLRQYAPELAGAFLELEKLSRSPGQEATFPQVSADEARKNEYEKMKKQPQDGDHLAESMINSAISRGDFGNARKIVAKLTDEYLKLRLLEIINMKEAVSLARQGNLAEADRLAQRLSNATSILEVYPIIIDKCVTSKNESYAAALIYQAVEQLKYANNELSKPRAGIPAFSIASDTEIDPALLSLGKLVKSISPINEALALYVLDEVVRTANRSKIDTDQGRTGFDTSIFKTLALNNAARVRQAAGNFQDSLRQIVALATVSQALVEKLTKEAAEVTRAQKKANFLP